MAAIKIIFETDEEVERHPTVWFWERNAARLCKKLGIEKLEVGFAGNKPVPVYDDNKDAD